MSLEKSVEELTAVLQRLSLNDHLAVDPIQPGPIARSTSSTCERGLETHNEFKNFSQLPIDILYTLFLSIKTVEPEESLHTIIMASHVCRRWRAVAIGAPLLWTYVRVSWTSSPRHHAHTIMSLLERSRNLPIILHFDIASLQNVEPYTLFWKNVFSLYTHRVHKLVITLRNFVNYISVVRTLVSPLKFPAMTRFYLDLKGCNRTQFYVSVKSHEPVSAPQCPPHPIVEPVVQGSAQPATRRCIMRHYLDWTAQSFQITSLSLKCTVIASRDLLPILVACRSTLVHLEYFASNCLLDWTSRQATQCITLPALTSFRIGYGCVDPAYWLVARLDLPNLSSVLLHDFRRCPEPGLPSLMPEKIAPRWTDAYDLLVTMTRFTKITNLALRGVECFTCCLEEVTEPLQALFRGLNSLALIKCDGKFFHILHNITLEASFRDLEGLSDLSITCYDYLMVLGYLRSREARGLPRLETLGVNSKMAILRHFVKQFANDFHIRGVLKHKHRQVNDSSHPYLRHPQPRCIDNKIRGSYPHELEGRAFHSS